MTSDYYQKITESVQYLKTRIKTLPKTAIVLGTGLGNFSSLIQVDIKIPYSEIPHFPETTVKGHQGELIFGTIHGHPVIAQNGRYHYYEGYNMKEVTFPIRVFKFLGVQNLIIASATGGIHEDYQAGDITIVNDHINLHHQNPLQGPNDDRLGTRFPDMMTAYTPEYISICKEVASGLNIKLYNSVYAGLPGPNLETKAEYKMLHIMGATVVGMSTVPEVLVAQHMKMKTCVLTAVTNKCWPLSSIGETTHDQVIEMAAIAEDKISKVVHGLIQRLTTI